MAGRRADPRVADSDIIDAMEEADADGDDGLRKVIDQLRCREAAIGARYPFMRDGNGIKLRGRWSDSLCYSFLLFTSLNQTYRELNYPHGTANVPAVLFELLTARALELYLQAKAIRIGAPRRAPVPTNFPDAVRFLTQQIGEPIGPEDVEFQTSGDDGCDVWVAKSFEDDRPSQVCVLAQCAIGQDWEGKRSDLDLGLWQRHVDWYSQPLTAFAVPFHHPWGNAWRETAARGGIVLDRPRLARLVSETDLPRPVAKAIRSWTRQRRDEAISKVPP